MSHAFAPRTVLAALTLLLIAPLARAETPPEEAWVHLWNGPGNFNDEGRLVAADPDGPIYVAGTTLEPESGHLEDVLLMRFDPGGDLVWHRIHGAEGNDRPTGMIVTQDGDVALVGFARDGDQNLLTTLRFDASGDLLWQRSFAITGGPVDEYQPQVVEDDNGNLLVSGTTGGDYLVLKYAADGAPLWDQTYDSPTSGTDQSTDLAVDAAGSVYVTGTIWPPTGEMSITTVKFDAEGTFHWAQSETGDFGSVFSYAGVEVAPDGGIVVAGNPESTCGLFQVRTWKLAAATGAVQWLAVFPEDPCDSMEPVDLAVDAGGNVVVTGFGLVGIPEYHFHTIRYDAGGAFQWHQTFEGVGSTGDWASSLALDADGNAYVAGVSNFSSQNRDWTAAKYTPQGDEAWSVHWAGPSGTNDFANDVAVTPAGDVVLTGNTWLSGEGNNAVTVLYRQDGVTATPPAANDALAVRALLNPFSRGTSIRFRVDQPGMTRLSVYDVRGRRVRVLRDGFVGSGSHEVAWGGEDALGRGLPSGTYILRLESARGVATERVGLVR